MRHRTSTNCEREQKFGRVLWRIGRELMEAYQEGRMDERQEQMRDMSAGAAAGGM